MPIYFIQAGDDGPIKIGFTNGSVRRRLGALRTGSHLRLSLIATLDGDAIAERELHKQFSAVRLAGEWFAPSPELLALCEQHRIKPPPQPAIDNSSLDFRTRLAALGLSQTELRHWLEDITGHRLAPTTTSRWAKGHRSPPPEMNALLAIIENPRLLARLKRRDS